jgi:hypothetical protein
VVITFDIGARIMRILDNIEHQTKHLVHRVGELEEVDQIQATGVVAAMPDSVAHIVNRVLDILPEVATDDKQGGLVKWTLSMEYIDQDDSIAVPAEWNGFSISLLSDKPE